MIQLNATAAIVIVLLIGVIITQVQIIQSKSKIIEKLSDMLERQIKINEKNSMLK